MSDVYGIVGALRPADLLEATLYTVPTGKYFNGMLRIVNHDATEQTYTISHAPSAPANAAYHLRVNGPIDGNWTEEFTISAGPGEKVQVKSGGVSKVSFHLSGVLMDA